MAKLTDSIKQFSTGDLVICYYPPKKGATLHLTLYFTAKDNPRGKASAGFIHAGNDGVEFTPEAGYAEYGKVSGFLHVAPVNEVLRQEAARIAAIWGVEASATPYGSYPGTKDLGKDAAPLANRFQGMRATADLGEIPFDFTALARLLKWVQRAHAKAPLSKLRGITCAAFAAACYQTAAMYLYLRDLGALERVAGALKEIDALLGSKADLRKGLKVLIPADKSKTGKPVYQGQALRQHSNRPLQKDAATTMNKSSDELDLDTLYEYGKKALTDLDRQWLYVQIELLGISPYSARSLEAIIPDDVRFDVKYINSPLLTDRLERSNAWRRTPFDKY